MHCSVLSLSAWLLVFSSYYMCGSCFGLQTLIIDNISLQWTLHFTRIAFIFREVIIVNVIIGLVPHIRALVLKSDHCNWLLE